MFLFNFYKSERLKVAGIIADATQPRIGPDGSVIVGGQGSKKALERATNLAKDLGVTVLDDNLDDHITSLLNLGQRKSNP